MKLQARLVGLVLCAVVGPASAAVTTYEISGAFGSNEHACTQITLLFGGADCTYGRNRPGAAGTWIGPLFSGGHYNQDGIKDQVFYVPTFGVFDANTLTFIPAADDGKLAAPVTGTFSIDNNGTPGNPDDDLVSGSFSIGAMARNIATGQATRAVQRWSTMDHVMAATPVNAQATAANGAGGTDYVIGSRGFPTRLCSAGNNTNCYPTSNASAVFTDVNPNTDEAVSFWSQIAPGQIGIERSGLLADPAFVDVQPAPAIPTGNVGATSTATFTGYSCSTNNLSSDDCTFSSLIWGAAEPAGFDNMVMKISTNGAGQITSGFVYWTEEYRINFGGPPAGYDNSWQGGAFSFTGSGGTPSGPNASDDQFTVARNSPGTSLNVLGNDSGFASPVTVTVLTAAQHGTATVTGSPGNPAVVRVNYVPDPGYFGNDTFEYTVDDGTAVDSAVVSITIPGPKASNDAASTGSGTPAAIDVLANDSGFGTPVTVSVTSGPDHGTAVVSGSPGNASAIRINYTPAAGFAGTDTLTYQVTDGTDSASATVVITVLGFKANDDAFVVLRNYSQYLNVLENDIGFKNPVTVSIIQYPGAGGSAWVNNSPGPASNVAIYYSPYSYNQPAEYTETFRYQVSDGVNTGTATVTIRVVTYAAIDDAATTARGSPVTIDVRANDLGFNYGASLGIFTNPQSGTVQLVGSPGNQVAVYTPNQSFLGVDTFEYAIDDGARIDTAKVTVRVIVDSDSDRVDDGLDNCLGAANADQRDADGDGFGTWCDGDFDNNGRVNFADLAAFRAVFATGDAEADFDGNGVVNFADLARLKALFGKVPGPSALAP